MSNYVISGKVTHNSLPLKSVHIKVVNLGTGEGHVWTDTGYGDLKTNGDGYYEVNMDSFSKGSSVGQNVNVILGHDQGSKFFQDPEVTTVTHTIGSGGGFTINFDIPMLIDKGLKEQGSFAHMPKSFEDSLAMLQQDFEMRVNSDDAGLGVLTASFVKLTTLAKYVRKIPKGYAAVIKEVFVTGSGTTDTVYLQLYVNNAAAGTGANDTGIGFEFPGKAGAIIGHYRLKMPLRVSYIEGVQESIVMKVKGSGTTDKPVVWVRGYLIKEEYNDE